MKHSTFYVQECPTCGRALQVRVEYLGRDLSCPHCRGKVRAQDPDAAGEKVHSVSLLARANELLSQSNLGTV